MPIYYGPWVDWHPDPVQVVSGGSEANGTYHHPTTDGVAAAVESGLLMNLSHNRAAFAFIRELGGPYPSDMPLCGYTYQTRKGLSGDAIWDGICPIFPVGTFIDSHAGGNPEGAFWQINNSARIGAAGGNQRVDGVADITGWQLRPWNLYALFDRWMNDDALADEWSAAVEATHPPGDGWFIDNEAYHPFFEELEYAADEPADTAIAAGYSGTSMWANIENDLLGWGYYPGSHDEPFWFGGDYTSCSFYEYSGGTETWLPAPPAWVPTQVDDPFAGVAEFVVPPDEAAEWDAITVLTLTHGGIVFGDDVFSGGEGSVTTGGRYHQILAFRATWRLPKFRWAREVDGVIRQYPRDDAQGWGSGTRLYPPTKADRTVGGIQ